MAEASPEQSGLPARQSQIIAPSNDGSSCCPPRPQLTTGQAVLSSLPALSPAQASANREWAICPQVWGHLRAAGEWGVGPCAGNQMISPPPAKSCRRLLLGRGDLAQTWAPIWTEEDMQGPGSTYWGTTGDTHVNLLELAMGCGEQPPTQPCPNRKCFCPKQTWVMASFPWELQLDLSS